MGDIVLPPRNVAQMIMTQFQKFLLFMGDILTTYITHMIISCKH
jgi:hypothetical protein